MPTAPFRARLVELQPSQLYVSRTKLARLASGGVALPVVRLADALVLTDGHTRALAAWLAGRREIRVQWDEDELDREAYATCVVWCREEGIHHVGDLVERVVAHEAYERLWYARCDRLHAALRAKRGS